jgi:alpha-1,2-mannosyltransferase
MGLDGAGLPTALRRVLQALIVLAVIRAGWQLFSHIPYRIDADVYRMGGRAWLDSDPLYADGAMFHTSVGLDLPFTYPPLAAIVFSPLALMSLPAAGVVITAITCALLVVSMVIVLNRLDVRGRAGWWASLAIVALSVTALEPIRANFSFGQINAVLMTLVIADCIPRRTPWPRGVLLGLAIALKLTPAVFLLYLLLRRDLRAATTAVVSFAAATALGFAAAWRDSLEYWTGTVTDTDRIGTATWNTNQNAAGTLARLGLSDGGHFAVWTAVCVAMLALTIWSARRVLGFGGGTRDGESSTLALMCVALFGLVVSPVSWSHHWVWALPVVVVTGVLGYRRRSIAWVAVTAAGIALMLWPPLRLLPEHHEAAASWWRQLFGTSYVWWAVATVVVAGASAGAEDRISPRPSRESAPRPVPGVSPTAHPS